MKNSKQIKTVSQKTKKETRIKLEDYEEFRRNPLFATFVSEMAQELYSFTCYDFDNIYEKAVEIVHNR